MHGISLNTNLEPLTPQLDSVGKSPLIVENELSLQAAVDAQLYDRHKQFFTSVVVPMMMGTTLILIATHWRNDRTFYCGLLIAVVLDVFNIYSSIKNRIYQTPFGRIESRSDGFDTFRWTVNLILDVFLVWFLGFDLINASLCWIILTIGALSEVYYQRNRVITALVSSICFVSILYRFEVPIHTSIAALSCFLGIVYVLYRFERWMVKTMHELVDAEAKRKFFESESDLMRREAVLGSQTRSICHEINNVLAIIQGTTDVLKGGQNMQPEMYAKHVDRVARSVRTLSRVSTVVMDDIGKSTQVKRCYPLPELFADLSMLLDRHFRVVKGAQFDMVLPPMDLAKDFHIEEWAGVTYLILHNITKNAMEACTLDKNQVAEGQVRFECRIEGHNLLFAISDSGPGIPEKMRDDILQGSNSTTTKASGHGLGLRFVVEQIRKSKMNLTLESVNPHGTCFTVSMPIYFAKTSLSA